MNYDKIKTNIIEIDKDHSNITSLIKMMIDEGINAPLCEKLIHAIINHMSHEEEICKNQNLNFTQYHKKEHERLTGILRNILNNREFNEHNLKLIHQILDDHFMNFDSKINLHGLTPVDPD